MYDESFFDEETRTALIAAKLILPDVLKRTGATSVIDVGCGTGAWLSVAIDWEPDTRILGVDGYAPEGELAIPSDDFRAMDISRGVSCEEWDLAICLEVAEHLPETSAAVLVDGLCEAKFVLWSAAIPGQGGVNHVNEQQPSYWKPLFADNGYVPSTDIRRKHWKDRRMADFYRQNILIWAKPEDLAAAGYKPETGKLDKVHPDLAKAKGWS